MLSYGSMTQYFVDAVGTLGNVRKTAVGGLLVDATLARVGVLEYVQPGSDRRVRRYNPPEVLQQSLDELATVPVTNRHPKRMVDVHTFKEVAAGHIVGTPRFDGTHIHATLAIQDAALIRDIELGVAREVSMGYLATHDGKPGVTVDGETYDEARVAVTWNHLALVPAGRAGRSVRLLLDSEEIPEMEMDDMKIKIAGNEVDVSSAQSVFDAYDADLQAQLASATAAKDAALAQVKELEAKLTEATSDAAIDAAVQKRLDEKAAAEAKAAKLDRVKAAYPSISLDGRSDDFIDALDMRIELDKSADPEGLKKIASKDAAPTTDAAPKASPRAKKLSRAEKLAAELAKQGRSPLVATGE
jgi:hypothetical protein